MPPLLKNMHSGLAWLLGLAAVVIVLAGLKAAETIVIPIILAIFIGIICTPPLHFLTRKGVPVVISLVLIIVFLVVFGGLLGLIIASAVDSFIERLPEYQQRLEAEMVSILPWLESLGVPITRQQLLTYFNPSLLMDWVSKALTGLGALVTNVFLILFIVIFFLFEEAGLADKLRLALPNADNSLKNTSKFVKQVNKYLVIKSIISLITGALVSLFLWAVGVDFPLLWGLIALLMNFIPNIGSILAAVPAVLLASVQLGFAEAGIVALGYLVINTLIGNIVEPRFMGRGLGLSPLVVFLSLILWGWLFGAVGMFLSIPLTMIAKIALEQAPSTRGIAIMLGDGVLEEEID